MEKVKWCMKIRRRKRWSNYPRDAVTRKRRNVVIRKKNVSVNASARKRRKRRRNAAAREDTNEERVHRQLHFSTGRIQLQSIQKSPNPHLAPPSLPPSYHGFVTSFTRVSNNDMKFSWSIKNIFLMSVLYWLLPFLFSRHENVSTGLSPIVCCVWDGRSTFDAFHLSIIPLFWPVS